MQKIHVISGLLAAMLASAGVVVSAAPVTAVLPETSVGAGSTNDALFAIEGNRASIVDRIMMSFDGQIKSSGSNAAAIRSSLMALRADHLLSASLSNTFRDVSLVLAEPVATGPATHRYVTVSPTAAAGFIAPEFASSFVLRTGDDLSLAAASELAKAAASARVVGYFVPNVMTSVTVAAGGDIQKDGVGSGSGSWIGFVAGGNTASGTNSAVAAGFNNSASAQGAFVGAGQNNNAGGVSSLVIGGFSNRAVGLDSLVGSGAFNLAQGARAVVVGGYGNAATGNFSFVGGGGRDPGTAAVAGADVRDNIASGLHSAVVGGMGNRASGTSSFVGGGGNAGGSPFPNTASGSGASVVGGFDNQATGFQSIIGGGFQNRAAGGNAVVPGGFDNQATGGVSFAAGQSARAISSNSMVFNAGTGAFADSGVSTFNVNAPGGFFISPTTPRLDFGSQTRQMINLWGGGTTAYGIGVQGGTQYYRVDAGASNTSGFAWFRGGSHSDVAFAPGTGGLAVMTLSRDGQLVLPQALQQQIRIGDSAAGGDVMGIGAQNFATYVRVADTGSFAIYKGGIHSITEANPGTGGEILGGFFKTGNASLMQNATVTGTLRVVNVVATSDRASKTDFLPINAKAILAKVAALPLSSWAYKHEGSNGVRHIGPMSQDFNKAFKVGPDDKTISMVDASGIALTAIKGLSQIVKEKDAEIATLKREMAAIKKKLGM